MSKTIGPKEAAMRALREAQAIPVPRPPARTVAASQATAVAKLTADIARVTEAGKPKVSDTKPKVSDTKPKVSDTKKRTKGAGKSRRVTIRLAPEFHDWLCKRADQEGLDLGAYIRRELGP